MLNTIKKDIDRAISAFLKEAKPRLSVGNSTASLYYCIDDFLKRDGKRIRPLLFLLGYTGYARKKANKKQLYRAAIATELLHDFLLVHDDIIDKSDLRRGKPTMHKVFNKKLGLPANDIMGSDLAIVAGDIIYALAIECFLEINGKSPRKEEALRLFLNATIATGIGEFVDVVNNIRSIDKVSHKDIMLTYTYKTSKYTFEAPMVMGAMLAGASKKELDKLSSAALTLGQAFQIQDDLLDVFSSTKKTGKPILSDISEGKKTLLVWKTARSLKGADKKAFIKLMNANKRSKSDTKRLYTLIKDSGAGDYCFSKMNSLFDDAVALCIDLNIRKKELAVLGDFVHSLVKRNELIKL